MRRDRKTTEGTRQLQIQDKSFEQRSRILQSPNQRKVRNIGQSRKTSPEWPNKQKEKQQEMNNIEFS